MYLFHLSAKKLRLPKCEAKVDVGFILDSSGSVRKNNNYQIEKDFLKALAGAFDISSNGSRAGVITFSYYTEHSIKMNDHQDISSFNKAVDAIPLMGSTTRIDKALRLTQRELFSSQNGGRPGVTKLLILLTDGSQTQDAGAEDPGFIADEIRRSGIIVLIIGIGADTDETELERMAGGTDNLFNAASFSELNGEEFANQVAERSCEEGKGCLTYRF